MSWASKRTTTREEDVAYSLLGIFGVNMPLLYGEGGRAFIRLQEEIIKTSNDQTILTWTTTLRSHDLNILSGFLARTPADFAACRIFMPDDVEQSRPFVMTNKGLRMELLITKENFAILSCRPNGEMHKLIAIKLVEVEADVFWRHAESAPCLISRDILGYLSPRTVYLQRDQTRSFFPNRSYFKQVYFMLRRLPSGPSGYNVHGVIPDEKWDPQSRVITGRSIPTINHSVWTTEIYLLGKFSSGLTTQKKFKVTLGGSHYLWCAIQSGWDNLVQHLNESLLGRMASLDGLTVTLAEEKRIGGKSVTMVDIVEDLRKTEDVDPEDFDLDITVFQKYNEELFDDAEYWFGYQRVPAYHREGHILGVLGNTR
jgi:hypothetical protein